MSRCCIVPPHILRELALSGSPELSRCAERTLVTDERARRERGVRLDVLPRPPAEAPSGPGPQRTIHDAQQLEQLPGDVVRREDEGPTGDAATDEAYDGLGHTWQLWDRVYGRDSLDGAGMALLATVHYGRQYVNAFWDGAQMVFGDGDGEIFGRFTRSLDVIGHELAHGVTEHTSRLVYEGQSGALNEHVSDVFGVLVKQHHLGQEAAEADWLIGAELLMPSVRGRALRSMAAPGTAYDDPRIGRDPQPAHMRDFVRTSDDNGGVHINSGIPNKAFHLVATTLGGPAWERAGRIWFDVITGEIDPRCDFTSFAGLTHVAATQRYGPESPEAEAVARAWTAVGVELAPAPAPAPAGAADGTRVSDDAPVSDGSETKGSGGDRSATPADGSDAGTLVRVTRSGGVAGTRLSQECRVDELPVEHAGIIRSLLTDPGASAAAEPGRPDAFVYGLSTLDGQVDVRFPQTALSQRTRELLESLLRGLR